MNRIQGEEGADEVARQGRILAAPHVALAIETLVELMGGRGRQALVARLAARDIVDIAAGTDAQIDAKVEAKFKKLIEEAKRAQGVTPLRSVG